MGSGDVELGEWYPKGRKLKLSDSELREAEVSEMMMKMMRMKRMDSDDESDE